MNLLLKEREVAFYLGDSGARVLFAWHEFADAGPRGRRAGGRRVRARRAGRVRDAGGALRGRRRRWPSATDGDTAVILYTSGTTGTPKGAELTHGNLRRNAEASVELFGLDERHRRRSARCRSSTPSGRPARSTRRSRPAARLTLLPRFDAGKALEMIERDGVTVFEGVPTMYAAMLHHPSAAEADTSTLEVCVSGGAAMPVEVMRAFEERFGCQVLEGYGLSETSPVASFNRRDRERKPGSIGLPVDGVEMRVVDDDGNQLSRRRARRADDPRPQRHEGLLAAPGRDRRRDRRRTAGSTRATSARVDEDGYFFIVDRKKELVIRGGFNVYPREIEEVIYEHPAVREAAVIGVPHETLGEEVAAAIALKAGATRHAPRELRDFVKQRVAAYKYPRHVWLVDELPKGPTGKILKREIRPPAVAED